MRTRSPVALQVALVSLLSLTACVPAPRDPATGDETPAALRIEVSYASGVHEGPLTGRLFLALSPTAEPEPRIAAYHSARQRDGRVLGEPYARVITGGSTGRIRGRSARTGDAPVAGERRE